MSGVRFQSYLMVLVFLLWTTSMSWAQELGSGAPIESVRPQPRPEAVNSEAPSLSVLAYDTEKQAPKSCEKFIEPDGKLGEYGERVIRAVRDVSSECFYEKIDFSYLCPKYSTFRPERKNQFLAFLFASIAAFESSCDLTKRAKHQPGRNNDVPDGLFQLEYSGRQRAAAGRSKEFCAPGEAIDTQSLDFQTECAASIFSKTYCEPDTVPGKSRSGYWEKLKKPHVNGANKITQLIKRFPYCK